MNQADTLRTPRADTLRTPRNLTPSERTYALQQIGRRGITYVATRLNVKPTALTQWAIRHGVHDGMLTNTRHLRTVTEVAVEAGVTPHAVHRLANEHNVLTFAGTKDAKRKRGRIAYVPRDWAEAFITKQIEQRENAHLLSLDWQTVHQTAATLGVTPTVISAALKGKGPLSQFLASASTVPARLPGLGGLALLIDPQTIDQAKAHLNRERAETGTWVQTKTLMLELNTSYPTILRHARRHGCEPRWAVRDGISMRLIPPDIANKIRESVQASPHVKRP